MLHDPDPAPSRNRLKRALSSITRKRQARRTPSGLDFVLSDRIDFVNPAHWDALAAQTVFLSRDYLRVLEAHAPENVEPRYALAFDEHYLRDVSEP